jgi:general secretion pathway protein F
MQFQVRALRGSSDIESLLFEAASEGEAASQARGLGYAVLAVKARPAMRFLGGGSKFPLVLFSQELLALLEAGLSLVEGIETLAEREHRAGPKRVLEGVIARLYEGQAFSSALQQYPEAFPPLYVAGVRASERTGDLEKALARYIQYQSQLDVIRKRLISASIYPVLLMGVGLLVTLFLMGYVVPKFSRIYEDIGHDIPFLSRLLVHWGRLVEEHGLAILAGFSGAVILAGQLLLRPQVRRWISIRLWKVPALGEMLKVYHLARFYRTLGMLGRGGIPVLAAIDMVAGLLPEALRGNLDRARERIREGQPISRAMEEHGMTTPVALRLLRVGERTGRMGEMMERIASFHEEDAARWTEWLVRLFEPLLMVVIGVIIGGVVFLMYMPIFELAGSIQ